MKTRFAKFLALAMAMLMVVSAFAGCGKSEPPDTPPADDTQNGGTSTDSKYEDAGKVVITDTFYPQYPEVGEYDEMKAKLKKWFDEGLESGNIFSATIDGQSFDKIFPRFTKDIQRTTNEDGDELITATYTDEATHVKFTLEAVLYGHSPSLDYVINVSNTSSTENTPIITDLNSLDSDFEMKASGGYTVHTNEGSHENIDDFKPIVDKLTKAEPTRTYGVTDGTSSNATGFPFFDVIGKDEGLIMAIGWSGQWESDFKYISNSEFNMRARQQNFNALLFPEESIRMPRIVMTYFTGDEEYGHNIWRRLVLSDYTPPTDDPEGFKAPLCASTWGRTAKGIKKYLEYYKDSPVEIFWIDAGWYSQGHQPSDEYGTALGTSQEGHIWHHFLGVWSQNKILYPNGLEEVADFVHDEMGMKFMLWWMIEDARGPKVKDWTFDKSHYILARNADGSIGYASALDLSSDETTDMLIDYFSYYIEEVGIDCVRLDKSTSLDWHYSEKDRIVCRENNLPENSRDGITEAKYVVNLYRVWDTLYEKYPQFLLDNCSSGGRRIDIEMTKRGIPLWRTDYGSSEEATQAMTQYFAKWIPLNCIGNLQKDEYTSRTKYSACNIIALQDNPETAATLVKWLEEFEMLRPYWYGDYYQLLPENRDVSTWQAYQLYREDWQEGMIVVIRRGDAPMQRQNVKIEGLMPDREYTLHNIDDEGTENDIVKTGKELMENGIDFSLAQREIDCYIISLNRIDTDVIR